ncbi:hypothetical protein Q4Q57_13155 [Shewanella sp. SP2S2-6]|uniref:hypothetical protein n=1 Tax=Shewanella sp. SP2S2-6 TaxID=3063540 RepID=UPI00289100F6|nr:hypothetical protein [Shewanella sp. SP2S2-6]MDT3296089.1 hypothetical protein [Shewanella sp. SP2S2-6]
MFMALNFVVNSGYALANESCIYPCDPLLSKTLDKKLGTSESAPFLEVDKPQKVTIPHPNNSQMTMHLVIPAKPEDDWFNMPNGLAVLAIFISGVSFIYSIISAKKAQSKSINDDFWMRTVTIPLTIKHVMELVTEGVGMYRDQERDMRKFFDFYYLKKANLIRANFLITGAISPNLPDLLNSLVDDLEDSLSDALDEESVAACLSKFLSDVVSHFKSVQFKS